MMTDDMSPASESPLLLTNGPGVRGLRQTAVGASPKDRRAAALHQRPDREQASRTRESVQGKKDDEEKHLQSHSFNFSISRHHDITSLYASSLTPNGFWDVLLFLSLRCVSTPWPQVKMTPVCPPEAAPVLTRDAGVAQVLGAR